MFHRRKKKLYSDYTKNRVHNDEKLGAEVKTCHFQTGPDYIGKSSKPNIDSFIVGNSDHLLLVYVKTLQEIEVRTVLNRL